MTPDPTTARREGAGIMTLDWLRNMVETIRERLERRRLQFDRGGLDFLEFWRTRY